MTQIDNVVFSYGFAMLSDAQLKTDVVELDNALGAIAGLRGVRFSWVDEASGGPASGAATGQRQIGVLAQEVATVLPEIVHTNAAGMISVDYGKLAAVLVQAVKELERRVAILERKAG
ncbi:tail fiber domain-containing protein [Dactylosporangium sp. NPDC051485]|uniref:tail fiber domain-containing protein n=1 Tax=Dactylosporangium sp. NPDC051485 TaxID=3154846 RepID=UPI003431AF72